MVIDSLTILICFVYLFLLSVQFHAACVLREMVLKITCLKVNFSFKTIIYIGKTTVSSMYYLDK